MKYFKNCNPVNRAALGDNSLLAQIVLKSFASHTLQPLVYCECRWIKDRSAANSPLMAYFYGNFEGQAEGLIVRREMDEGFTAMVLSQLGVTTQWTLEAILNIGVILE